MAHEHRPTPSGITLQALANHQEAEACAAIMVASEPWKTLLFTRDASLQALTHPLRQCHVAHCGGAVAGFVVFSLQGPFAGYVQLLGVAPGLRDQGVGALLLAFAEDRIFESNANVFLCVSSFNAGARQFYLRHGYREVGELSDYVIAGLSEILMRKTRGPMRGYAGTSIAAVR